MKKGKYSGCEDRWNADLNFRQRMMNENGYTKAHMQKFDQWAKEPKAQPKPMSMKERQERFGDYKWYSAQVQEGGQDTVPTEQYPKYLKEEAIVAQSREKTKLTESSTSWNTQHEAPSSSSTSWNQNPWRQHDWQEEREDRSQWQSEPWNEEEESQWKRQKW